MDSVLLKGGPDCSFFINFTLYSSCLCIAISQGVFNGTDHCIIFVTDELSDKIVKLAIYH